MNYFTILVRVLQDMRADRTRIRMPPEEVVVRCVDLAHIVRQTYTPDIVVAIETGGSTPGELIARVLDISIVRLAVRRDIHISRRYSLDPIPLRWIMSMYHHFLFQTTRPVVSSTTTLDVEGKRVLVVEDTVHTGATVDVVTEYLRRANALDIKVAALAYVGVRTPDFSILPRGNYSFPWSRDYNSSG